MISEKGKKQCFQLEPLVVSELVPLCVGLEAVWTSGLLAISLFTTFVWGLNPKAFLKAVKETAAWGAEVQV